MRHARNGKRNSNVTYMYKWWAKKTLFKNIKTMTEKDKILIVSMVVLLHSVLIMGEVEKGILKYIVQTSLQGCEHGCEKMPLCVTAKFHRFSSLCTLYSIERDQTPDPGFYFYTKPSFITPDETHNCGNAECSCGEPAPIKSTQILGNMVSVGSKIKYHCLDASNSQISKCLSNGTWSHVEISCNCSLPDNIHGVPLPWSYLLRDRNSLEAHVACSEVCTSSSDIAATCNPNTGVWSFSTGSCCFNFGKNFNTTFWAVGFTV